MASWSSPSTAAVAVGSVSLAIDSSEVAPLGDRPFVVELNDHRGDERDTAASLGEMPTTLVRRLISPLSRSSGFVDQILRQCLRGAREGEEVLCCAGEHRRDLGGTLVPACARPRRAGGGRGVPHSRGRRCEASAAGQPPG